MIRALPLIVLGLVFAWLAINVSTLVLWLIAGACVLALISLIMFMYWRDSFVGPRTLVDDAKRLSKRMGRSDDEEAPAFERVDLETALDQAFEADGRKSPRQKSAADINYGDDR